jgi:hypothetical protein
MLSKINISPDRQKLIVYVVLVAVTLAVYCQVNQFDFINIDDPVFISDTNHIQSGFTLEGFRWAFSTTSSEFWHPLTWLSFMLDYQIYGLNAGGFHVTNVILHILSTLLLFWLFNHMTGEIWKSAFVAAFFALHPLRVESVAWVAERKDVLSVFFWLLTLSLYVYYTEKPVIKKISAGSFFLCVRSYEQVHGCHSASYHDSFGLLATWALSVNETRFYFMATEGKDTFFYLIGNLFHHPSCYYSPSLFTRK